jgi:hypothetical protein
MHLSIRNTLAILHVSMAAAALAACSSQGDTTATTPAPAPDSAHSGSPAPVGNPPTTLASLEDEGKMFVAMRGCARCHQAGPNDGLLSGQTAPRPGTSAYPANLTPDPGTGIGLWTTQLIMRALQKGLDDQGQKLCAPMPVFSDMGDHEALAIASYLQTLPPVQRSIPDSSCDGTSPPPQNDDDAGTQPPADDGGAKPPPQDDASTPADGGTSTVHDGGSASDAASSCAGYADPTTTSTCQGCGMTHTCQANGCYGGYYCQVSNGTCHPKPASCP